MKIRDEYFTYMKSLKRSAGTLFEYRRHLEKFFEDVGKSENEMTSFDVMSWVESLSNYSSATINQNLSIVKSYFDFLELFGYIDRSPASKVKAPVIKNKPKHYMEASMISDMIRACQSVRDKAIISLYASAGLRVSELMGLTVTQYEEMKSNNVNYIVISGKGDKKRSIPFNDETIGFIDSWLRERKEIRTEHDNLFITNQGNPIATSNMNTILKRVAKRAGIPFASDMSNHQLRAACATIYAEKGVPIEDVRDLLGHTSIDTTSRYIKSSVERVNNMVMESCFVNE